MMRSHAAPGVRACWTALVVLGPALAGGCTKQVPVADGTFEAQQSVVLDLKSGGQLRGKIAAGSSVDYREEDRLYSCKIRSLSDSSIVLQDLLLITSGVSRREVASRLADARVDVGERLQERVVWRRDIDQVHRVQFDAVQTARRTAYWTWGGVVALLLVGERS